jgi:hypothetical protein
MIGGIRETSIIDGADLADALHLAATAHADQFDKSGLPYITHILRMVEAALTRGCAPDVPIVAALHDIVEDSVLTLDDLRECGFSERVVLAVDALTRRDGEPYTAFITRCRQAGAVARCVKLLDIGDNLDPRRLDRLDPATRRRLRDKYEAARSALQALEDSDANPADAHSKNPPEAERET